MLISSGKKCLVHQHTIFWSWIQVFYFCATHTHGEIWVLTIYLLVSVLWSDSGTIWPWWIWEAYLGTDCAVWDPVPLSVLSLVGRSGGQTRCCADSCPVLQTTSASPSGADEELQNVHTLFHTIKDIWSILVYRLHASSTVYGRYLCLAFEGYHVLIVAW